MADVDTGQSLRYRVIRAVFDSAGPLFMNVGIGRLKEDETFEVLSTFEYTVPIEFTLAILGATPDNTKTRMEDLSYAFSQHLLDVGLIVGELV